MNAAATPIAASRVEGGFYTGQFLLAGVPHVLITAPKALGQIGPIKWNDTYGLVEGALSFYDGLANTIAMAKAGSKLAERLLDLKIDGMSGFYLPALGELELQYRVFKPGAAKNSQWARSGINLSAASPTYPYTPDLPAQTAFAEFLSGGAAAFEEAAYWSSTQHAAYADYAWGQDFGSGSQRYWTKSSKLWARAVRRVPL